MAKENIFSQEELKAMGELTLDLLKTSIENGDKETAKKLSQRMYNEFLGMHDLYRDWVTDLLTYIGKRYGDEVLSDAIKETIGRSTMFLGRRYTNKSTKRKIEMLLAGFRGHLQPLKIEEDEEKLTVTVKPCGSGGRLVMEGGYGPPCNFLRIKKPQPMTFNRPDFPVYCTHCFFQNISPTEPGGKPLFITEPAKKIGEEPCHVYIYK